MKVYVNLQSAGFCQRISAIPASKIFLKYIKCLFRGTYCALKCFFFTTSIVSSGFLLFYRSLEHPFSLMMSVCKCLWTIWRNLLSPVLPEILHRVKGTGKPQPDLSFISFPPFCVSPDRMLWDAPAPWLDVVSSEKLLLPANVLMWSRSDR